MFLFSNYSKKKKILQLIFTIKCGQKICTTHFENLISLILIS